MRKITKTEKKMMKGKRLLKISLMLVALLGIKVVSVAQTTLISPTGDGGFETGATPALNHWTAVNSSTDAWIVGTTPVVSSGTKCAFISSNSSAWTYSQLSVVQHIYYDVTIPTGHSVLSLTFKWKALGEGTTTSDWDNLKVFWGTSANIGTPVANTGVSATYQVSGAGAITGMYKLNSATWNSETIALSGNPGSVYRLVFSWKSDVSTIANPPAALDEISLTSFPQLTGTKTIKASGGDYATFTTAINALNTYGVGTGGVTFNVDANLVSIENCPIITATGTLANPIVFQKSGSGANPIIKPTGTAGTSDAGIAINGGDYITFDGIDITENTGSAVEYGYYITNASTTNGAQNNTIKNTTITLNRANTSSIGIYQNAVSTPSATGNANSTNKYYNLTIKNVYSGILLNGNVSFPDQSCEIGTTACATRNVIGDPATSNDIGNGATTTFGIKALNQAICKIYNNDVTNVTTTGAGIVADGIWLEFGTPSNATVNLGTSEIYLNKISGISCTSTGTTTGQIARGIRINQNANVGSIARVYNNFIWNLQSATTNTTLTTRKVIGMSFQPAGSGSGSGIYAEFNSVSINATTLGNSNTCLEIGSTSGPVLKIRNNILSNTTAAQSGSAKHYCWITTSATSFGPAGSVSNYNDLYVANTNGFVGLGATTDYASLANWQAITALPDANSKSVDPVFTSSTDLHASAATIASAADPSYATNTAWATLDIDCATRPTATDIGADQFTLPSCATATSPTTGSTGVAQTASLSWGTVSIASSYDVYFGTDNPPTNIANGTNQSGTTYTPGSTMSASTAYYWKIIPRNATGSATGCSVWTFTTQAAVPTLSTGSLASFGNICDNTTSSPNSFNVSAVNLTGDVTVNALAGFSYSTSSGGSYTSTLTLTPSSGSINTSVYVKFTPTTSTSYNGNIVINGGGISADVNVAAVGSGIDNMASLVYSSTSNSYCTTVAVASNTVASVTGSGTITYSVSPALPTGLSLNTTTGAITGTPTVTVSSTYTVTASNGCSSTTAALSITVITKMASLTYISSSATYCVGTTITSNTVSAVTGTGTISYTVSSLPAGLNLNSSTGAITGTPTTVTGSASYTVTASNGCSTTTASLTIVVSTAANVTSPAASVLYTSSSVSWTNPANCFNEILIVARAGSANDGTPTGDGSAYTGNLAFGSGTALGSGFVVYKGSTSPAVITGLTNGTIYYYKLFTRSGSVWSSGVEVSATPAVVYCTPSAGTSDGISGVIFNTVSNTGTGLNNYTNYSATISTTVIAGNAYNLSVYSNTGGSFTNYQKVWIDWNHDGTFNTTAGSSGGMGEEYTLGTATNVTNGISSLCPLSVTVPIGAAIGNTLMRVSSRYSGYTTSCATGIDGEFEDYGVNILGPPPVVNSSLTASSNYGTGSSYIITGSNTPTSYNATTGLPSGMSVNTTSGVITVAATTAAGTYNITISATNGSGTGSATLVYTVNKPTLTVTASTQNKTYGGTAPTTGTYLTNFTVSGLQNSDAVNGATLGYSGSGNLAAAAVGTYTITPSAVTFLTGTSANYTISYVTGTLTIDPASLSITASAQAKNYGTVSPTSGTLGTDFTVSGLHNSDAVSGATLGYSGSPAGNLATASVGTYTITPSAVTFSTGTGSNYSITYNTSTLTINTTALTITGNNISKTEGDVLTNPTIGSLDFSSNGLVNSETIGSVTITYTSADVAGATTGVYTNDAIPSAAIGGTFTASNYSITYVAGNVTVTSASSPTCPLSSAVSPSSTQTLCEGVAAATLTNTITTSGTVGTPTYSYQWYYNTTNSNTILGAQLISGATSNTYTPLTTAAEVGDRYYFCVGFSTDNSCAQDSATQSLASNVTKVTVNATPSTPTGSSSQTFCSVTSPTVANLSVTGTSINWYNATIGGTLLSSGTALTSANYYATQTILGCESSTLDVLVTVNTTPSAPTGSSGQTLCSASTVASLAVIGSNIVWYNASSGGSVVSSNTSVVSGTHYYASQTVSGCESTSRLDVTATLNGAVAYGTVGLINHNTHVVISQVYGAGGNASATYNTDFVELFNPTGNTVSLTGWVLQYASNTGAFSTIVSLSGSIASGKYYLISLGSGGAVGSALPTADATGSQNMAAANGKVQILNASSTLIDLVGYGTATTFEGTAAAPAPSATASDFRANAGCTDGNNNSTDFTTATPAPRNSATAANSCATNSETICSGSSPSSMSVTGAVNSGSFSYQWYYQTGLVSAPTGTSTSGWTSLGSADGANTDTYLSTSPVTAASTYACFVSPGGSPSCGTGTWATGSRQVNIYSATTPTFTASAAASTCINTATVYTTQSGFTNYTWVVPGTLGTDYTISAGSLATTSNTVTLNWLTTGSKTVTVNYTNTNGCVGVSAATNTTTVISVPIAVTPTSGTYCSPGGTAVSLTASGATTYAWSPSTGLSATTGATVNASPSTTITYTVTGTLSGCTATTTAAITASAAVTMGTVSATPSSVCSGGSSSLSASGSLAASASAFIFGANSTTYTPLSGGTPFTAVQVDDIIATAVPIGFIFNYSGNAFTNVYPSSNGFLSFNSSASGLSSATNALAAPSSSIAPLVAPLWDDLDGTTGSASYLTTGNSGNHIFTFEWLNWEWNYAVNATVISFQVKLYEATGKVEFIYRQEANAVGSGSASIGITGISGNYLSLNGTGTSPSASSSSETTSLATKPTTGQSYSFSPPSPSYSWNPSTFLNNTSIESPTASAITSAITYTVTGFASGCSSTGTVTISIGALTCGALNLGGTACVGNQTVTANPSGGGTPYNYSWTEDGSAFGGNTATITASSGTHTYSCTITDACTNTCSSNASVTTNALPLVAVTPSSATYCTPGSAVVLTASGASTYSWGPATGLSITTGANVNASPASATTYTVTGTDLNGCFNTASVVIGSSSYPAAVTVTPSSSTICNSSAQGLTASGGSITTSGTFGTQVSQNTSTTFPAVFSIYYGGQRNQLLILASELTAKGFSAGSQINSIGFPVISLASNWGGLITSCQNFQVSIGATSAPSITTFQSGLTQVIAPANFTPVVGTGNANRLTFNAPFTWNGTSNIIVETTFSNAITGNSSDAVIQYYTATSASSWVHYHADGVAASTVASTSTVTTTSTSRPDFVLSCAPITPIWSWSPNTASTTSISVSPSTSTTYTATASINGCSTSNTSTITVSQQPAASAGGSQTICQTGTATVSGASSSNGTILWTHNGGGSLSGTATLTPTYTAVAGDAGHTVTLTMTVSNSPCTAATATYTVNVSGTPTASAGGNQTICQTGTATVSGASSLNGTILWTHNGAGSLSGATTLTPVYTPGSGDAGNTVTLTMTVSNGVCSSATATYTVHIFATPTALAGGSQNVCQTGTATISGASSSNGTILWTHNGAGFLSGATTLTPTYTAVAGDVGHTVTLTMTVSNSPCTAATATYSVFVEGSPTATAGGSQTICQSATATISGASATNGSVLWTHNGAGTISDDNTLSPIYTPASGDVGNIVTLTMTVSSTNSCAPSSATASYTIRVGALNEWLGVVSNDWHTAINWCGGVPTTTTNVVIPSYATHMPIISGAAECNHITIASGSTLSIDGTGTLTLTGNWTNNGTFTSAGGMVTFAGSSAQTISGSNTFDNIYVNNASGVSLSNDITVMSILELDNGNVQTGSNKIRMEANAFPIAIGGLIEGNLEEYIPSGFGVSAYYPIGTGTSSAALDLFFDNVLTDGYVTASTTVGDHLQISTSGFNSNQTVNRTWSMSNQGVSFDQYQIGLSYQNSDKDAGFVDSYAAASLYTGSSWQTLPNSYNYGNYQSVSNVSSLGDFQIGVINPTPSLYTISPSLGAQLQTLDVVLKGSGFITNASSLNVGTGITVNTVTVNSDTMLTANISISLGASIGVRPFTVTNGLPGGGTSGSVNFMVTGPFPIANFVASSTTIDCNLDGTVTFNNLTNYATSYSWNFGIGATPSSASGFGPYTVSYSSTGSKTITLIATNVNGNDTLTSNITVNASVPGTPASITGPINLCAYVGQNVVYTSTLVNSATGYSWFVPSGISLVSGQGTSAITVTVNQGFTTGSLSVVATNACGSSISARSISLLVNIPASAPATMTGVTSLCSYLGTGSSVNYTCSTVTNATGYKWTLPSGINLVSGQGTTHIVATVSSGFTTGTLSVLDTNACGASLTAKTLALTATIPATAPASIAGATGLCVALHNGTNVNYTCPTVTNATGYKWTLPSGLTLVSGQGTTHIILTVGSGFTAGTLSVVDTNACGASLTSRTLALSATIPATAPTSITGTTAMCSYVGSNTTINYTCPTVTNATGYKWTLPSGLNLVSGQGTTHLVVTVGSSFTSGTLMVADTNACGSSLATRNVSLNGVPPATAPATLSGQAALCSSIGANEVYTCSSVSGAAGYNWTIPSGLTYISGQGTTSLTVNVDSSFTSGTLSVSATYVCGISAGAKSLVLNAVVPAIPPSSITGLVGLCNSLGSNVVYTCSSVTNATGYDWTLPTGLTTVSGQGTTSLTVHVDSTFVTGNLSVKATNSCGSSAGTTSISIVTASPALTGSISGPSVVCGLTSASYSASPVAGVSSYSWTVPTGLTITSGQGTPSINVTVAAGTILGTLTLQATNTCGSNSLTTAITKKPIAPSIISGPVSLCGQTTANYTTSSAGATSYTWTLPTGITVSSGTGTSSIHANIAATFVAGNINVTAVNACGSTAGTARTVYGKIPAATTAISGLTNVCGVTTTTYTATGVVGAASYTWTLPTGLSSLSTAGSSITVQNAGFTGGSISVQAINVCGTGAAKVLALSVASASPGVISGPTVTCGLTSATYSVAAVTGATGYTWTAPAGATLSGQGTSTIVATFATPMVGTVSVTSHNACANSAARTLAVTKISATPGAITGASTVCGLGSTTYSIAAIAGATNYVWTLPTGLTIAAGQGTSSIVANVASTAFPAGTIYVNTQNACGSSGRQSKAITACASPEEMTSETNNNIRLYPNPATSEYSMEIQSAEEKEIIEEVYDVLGNMVRQEKHTITVGENLLRTNIEAYKNGIYMIRIIDHDSSIMYTQRLIKQ